MPADTAPTTTCPPTAELERLVRGRLTEARSAALADHVGGCSDCQCKLDALAGGGDVASDLRACATDTPATDSAYWKALRAAEDELRPTTTLLVDPDSFPGVVEDRTAGVKLDFLQPADGSGRLGMLGQFGILRVVGRGGMGVVLHAYDPCLARDVAVKVIDPQLANNEVARQRFCREARAAAAVTHDNLVAVHQVDEDEASGLPYLVMQLIQGESLDQRLKRVGKLPPLEVARLGMQAAAGLAAAHASGLIHRDIKPGNILLEAPADRVKLTDFGLARAAEDVKLTRTGFVAGSPLYMAPEQARGDEVDPRSDLFSLGSVLYEAVAGAPPFEAKTPLAVLRRVADETPKPLHEVNPDVPPWLSDIIDRLLAKNPADRFQTAAEVAEAFAGELARAHALSPLDVPAEVCPMASGSRTTPRARKHVCWATAVRRSVLATGGMALGALLTWLLWSPAPVEKVVEVPAAEHGPAPRLTLSVADSGPVWAVAFLNGDRVISGTEDGAVRIWNMNNGAIQKTLEPRLGGNVWSADVSSDGKYLVTPSDDSVVTVWKLETFGVEYSFPQPTSTKAAVFSPDGTKLATGDRNATIRVWDLAAQIPTELHGHKGTVHGLAYSPDGSRLASAGSDGLAKVWNLADPSAKPIKLGEHRGPVYGVAFSPDGTKLASGGWDGTVRVWNANTGEQLQTIKAHDGDAWAVAFGGGGKWVASSGSDGTVKVWDVNTGGEVFSYRAPRAFHTVRFAKDGTTLAAGGRDGSVRVWDLPK